MTDSDFASALQSLGSRLAATEIDRVAYYESLARLLHDRFKPSRVNIWRLTTPAGGASCALARVAEYDPSPLDAPTRSSLSETEFAPYLEILKRQGVFVSDDAFADPALAPMREGYLVPGLVEALMDAAITINGVVVGVVCCEEVGRQRRWMRVEVTAMRRSIATVNVHLARLQADDDRATNPLQV